jgi:two-component system, NarL family, sensor kinase
VAQMEKTGAYEINLFVTGDIIFLDTKRELILFRIVQEALTNIIKHAAASIIKISIDYASDFVSLLISDNGKGFINNMEQKKGIGLINMNKRAKLLNGICEIKTNPADGTTIKIKIPLYDKEENL